MTESEELTDDPTSYIRRLEEREQEHDANDDQCPGKYPEAPERDREPCKVMAFTDEAADALGVPKGELVDATLTVRNAKPGEGSHGE